VSCRDGLMGLCLTQGKLRRPGKRPAGHRAGREPGRPGLAGHVSSQYGLSRPALRRSRGGPPQVNLACPDPARPRSISGALYLKPDHPGDGADGGFRGSARRHPQLVTRERYPKLIEPIIYSSANGTPGRPRQQGRRSSLEGRHAASFTDGQEQRDTDSARYYSAMAKHISGPEPAQGLRRCMRRCRLTGSIGSIRATSMPGLLWKGQGPRRPKREGGLTEGRERPSGPGRGRLPEVLSLWASPIRYSPLRLATPESAWPPRAE